MSEFEFVFQDEPLRQKILRFAAPTKDFFSYQNLDLATAVYHKEHDIYVTMIFYMSQAIMRDGRNADDYRYAVIYQGHCFGVSCSERLGARGQLEIGIDPLHKPLKSLVEEGILCYNDGEKRREFVKKQEAVDPEFSLYGLKERYRDELAKTLV